MGSTTETGYTVGGGLAWRLTGTALVLSAEYAFYDFGKARISTTSFNGGNPHVFDVDTSFHTGRIGLSYKLN
jgi:opacity protein-like surface antigen